MQDKLKDLSELLNSGSISQNEYETLKEELLESKDIQSSEDVLTGGNSYSKDNKVTKIFIIALLIISVLIYFLDKMPVGIQGYHFFRVDNYTVELIITNEFDECYCEKSDNKGTNYGCSDTYSVEYKHEIFGELVLHKKWGHLKYKSGKIALGGIYGDITISKLRDKIYFLNDTFENDYEYSCE